MPSRHTPSPLLLETIKIEGGRAHNLSYHQTRCDQSRKRLFGSTDTLELSSIITPPQAGLYRCRIVYAQELHSVEYIPYVPKTIHTLKIVSSDIDYGFKYADRTAWQTLLACHTDVDDILIEQNGLLTDTSTANIALYDGTQWVTPHTPLLEGTMRAKLLKEGFLQTRDIKKEDLSAYPQVALMNAMIGFSILKQVTFYGT